MHEGPLLAERPFGMYTGVPGDCYLTMLNRCRVRSPWAVIATR